MRKFQKPELLAPAGNMEKLRMALLYGADAVYLGGKLFGLRAFASNFSMEEMKRNSLLQAAVLLLSVLLSFRFCPDFSDKIKRQY